MQRANYVLNQPVFENVQDLNVFIDLNYSDFIYIFPTFAIEMFCLSQTCVKGSPSLRSWSPCRKNSSQARYDHSREIFHDRHGLEMSAHLSAI